MSKEEIANELMKKLDDKDFSIYFYTRDTKGNPVASVANTYEMVKNLNELGYNAKVLHDKSDYVASHPATWLGEEYKDLPHTCIESGDLQIKAEDFVIIPEVFANVMEELRKQNAPSKNIVLCQSIEDIFELLKFKTYWSTYGFNDVITTSDKAGMRINDLFPSAKISVVPPVISDKFKSETKLKQPIVSILSRDQGDIKKIISSFLLKHPIFSWVSFRDLRGLSQENLAEIVDKSCLTVWVDDVATFGTFPLESIECNTPVIAKLPIETPPWAVGETTEDGSETIKDSVLWVNKVSEIPDMMAKYLHSWLEDNVPSDLLEKMGAEKGKYTSSKQKDVLETVFGQLIQDRKKEIEIMLENTK